MRKPTESKYRGAARLQWKGVWLGVVLACLGATSGTAQQRAERVRLVDSPTAGLVVKGRYGIDLRLFAQGGVIGQMQAGALKRLTIGVAYGGERLVGDQDIEWYPRAETTVRYRLIEENSVWPALVLGYESQGYGRYLADRYQVKSKGVFAALSKNYQSPLGQFGLHGGVNQSREDDDGDSDISGWVGLDKSLNEDLSIVAEYDLALNDDNGRANGTGEGYLNMGIYGAVVPHLEIGLLLKNILRSGPGEPEMSRELLVHYSEEF
ncbi:MAG: hypothetical protein GKR89_26830 [Candidatus Latescibacteria bacterium]|nr:hypothetical protein [Candidatus Latescibacterota bacterium]